MNIVEVTRLLSLIQIWDKRTVGELEIMEWTRVIPEDIDFDRARQVVEEWYLRSRDMITLSDIVRGVRQIPRRTQTSVISSAREPLVPMPEWFRARYAAHAKAAGIPIPPDDTDGF